MRKLLLLCLFAVIDMTPGCVSIIPSADLTLVKAGTPLASIVIDAKEPTKSAQLAAFELRHAIKLITGAELPIVGEIDDVKGIPILVGESDATRKLKIPATAFQREEYLVEFNNKRIVLMGNDSPDYAKVDYADPKTFPATEYNYRSTTYAVYDFLEKCCGVRFYSFGDDGTTFERRPTLTVKPVSIHYSPKMDAFRNPYFGNEPRGVPPRDVKLLRLRWRLNTIFGEVSHNIYSIYWRYWDKAAAPNLAKLFIEKRPEYFAQGYAGTFTGHSLRRQYPNDPDLPPQVCTTNPGQVEYFAEEAFKVYNGEHVDGGYSNGILRMPGAPWFYPIGEEDNAYWCKCDKCKNEFPQVDQENRYDYMHFDWANRIAGAAAKRDPAIGIATMAYSQTLPYPDPRVLALLPNVSVQLCLSIESWWHPGIYARQHKIYKDWVDNEASKRPLTVWAYMLQPAAEAKLIHKYNQFFPVLFPWHAGRIFKELTQDGIRGYFAEVNPAHLLLEAYVANKVSFDPSVDIDKLIDEYFTLHYGAAAGPMRAFYRMVEDITWNPANYPQNTLATVPKSSYIYGIHTEKTNWHLGTRERMAKLQELIDQAGKQAATPLEKQRVKLFVDNIWSQAVAGRQAFEKRELERSTPVPQVTADYAGECGGALEKVDFTAAAKSGGWALLDGKELAGKPELVIASDSEYLYLKYHEDGDAAFKQRKAGLWVNNVEIFLAAQPDYPYGQLAIAPNGEFKALRHLIVQGVIQSNEWPLKPTVKNQLDENGWTFAVAIPLERLLPDSGAAPGDKLHANFMRTRLFEGGTSWAWSPIFSSDYVQGLYRMGQIFLAPPPVDGPLPVNGEFKGGSDALPDGWAQNKGDSFKPFGAVTLDNGRVSIVSSDKQTDLYTQRIFPARRGDQIVFEFIVSGKGGGSVGAYFCSGTGDGAGSRFNSITISSEPKKYEIVLPVANINPNRFTNGFRPVLSAAPDSQVEYSELKVNVIPRGKLP